MSQLDCLPFGDDLLRAGEALLRVHQRSSEWVLRRIEQVGFHDHRSLERKTTLDVALPSTLAIELPSWNGRKLVPVKALTRKPGQGLNVTVCLASGEELPQPSRRIERSYVASGLLANYQGTSEVGGDLYARVCGEIDTRLFGGAAGQVPQDDRTWLALLEGFRDTRLVVAAVPEEMLRGTATLRITISQPEPVEISEETDDLDLKTDDYYFAFQADQVEFCESFHFEVVVPPGLYVDRAQLVVETVDLPSARTTGEIKKRKHVFPEDDPYSDRAHIYCPVPAQWTTQNTLVLSSTVHVVVRPMTIGTSRAGTVTSALVSCLLVALTLTVGVARADGRSYADSLVTNKMSPDALVAAIMLGPTLLLGVIIRENEHLMTQAAATATRFRWSLQAFCTFAASIVIAASPDGWLSAGGLALLSTASLAATVVSVRSYRRSEAGLKRARP